MIVRCYPFWFLLAGFALCATAGCGGGGKKVKKYDFTFAQGHFRGVIYATTSPAPGESSIYTVDFTQPVEVYGAIIQDVSTYQSTTEDTGGRIKGVFGYSNNGTIPVVSFIFSETYHQNIPTPHPEDGATTQSFYPLFGPPTNSGTHYEGELIEIKSDGFTSSQGQHHKAVFDKVP